MIEPVLRQQNGGQRRHNLNRKHHRITDQRALDSSLRKASTQAVAISDLMIDARRRIAAAFFED